MDPAATQPPSSLSSPSSSSSPSSLSSLSSSSSPSSSSSLSASASASAVSVLVVDDDEDIRSTLVDCFRILGCTVFEAPDGMSALERARAHPLPMIVVLDWLMPGMDGLQVVQALASDEAAVQPYIFILVTAAAAAASAAAADAMERLTQDLAAIPANVAVTVLGIPFDLEELTLKELTAVVARAAADLAAVAAPIPIPDA